MGMGAAKPGSTFQPQGGMPAQGKGQPRPGLPPPGQSSGVPPQGGKGQNFGPNVFPAPQVQQPQVPAQGGKMSPLIQQVLSNQQQAQIQQPLVQQRDPQVQQRDPQVQQPLGGFPQPQTYPPQITNYGPGSFPQRDLGYGNGMSNPNFDKEKMMRDRERMMRMQQRPGQMPANMVQPQVMPAQGLMGLQNMLYGNK